MKAKGAVKLGKSGAIVSEREVRRFARAVVALVRWKRLKRRLPMEACAGWAGLLLRGWRNAERGRTAPNLRTLARMLVAVNLTLEDVLAILEARKIKHLRRISGRNNYASGGAKVRAE